MLKYRPYDESEHVRPNIEERGLAVKRWAILAKAFQLINNYFYVKKCQCKENENDIQADKDDIDINREGNTSEWDVTDGTIEDNEDNLTECSLCLGEYGTDQWFVLKSTCQHQFCIKCLQQYVRIEIQEGRVELKCPQCPSPMHPDDIENLAVDGDDKSKVQLYHHIMVQRVLVHDPDTRWCPAPDCTFGFIATDYQLCPKIDCERDVCNVSFCYHCKGKWEASHQCGKVGGKTQQQIVFDECINLRECPRCSVLVEKMDDGSCNHMKCSVCASEFCWLCMQEVTDLHYLSPSGCTFWGKKKWSKKKKILWQSGALIGAPVGIGLLAGISIPAIVIGIPVDVGRKLYRARDKNRSRFHRSMIVTSGVTASILISPVVAALAVSIGVPIMLGYTYVTVPISLCKTIAGVDR